MDTSPVTSRVIKDLLDLFETHYAYLTSPAFVGTPTAPTAPDATSNGQIATTAFVHSLITAVVGAAPATLDQIAELAAAIGNDPNFAVTLANSIATKLAKAANLSDLTDAGAARGNLGLGNVTNTSDANKPVSTAQQAALDAKTDRGISYVGTQNSQAMPPSGIGSVFQWNLSGGFAESALVTLVENPHTALTISKKTGHSTHQYLVLIRGAGDIVPGTDNVQNLGSAGERFATIYAGTGTISTSDARNKTEIGDIPDEWLDAWGDVRHRRFKFKDGARWHVGLVAQEVHAAFEARGIDAFQIGLCCFDSWEAEYLPVIGKRGQPLKGKRRLVRPAGDRWGLRENECQMMEAAWVRRALDRLGA